LVLRNNYLQTLCLSLAQASGTEENGYAIQFMTALETRGLLDRKLEALPSDAIVIERDQKNLGLTRPEFAVLMAYAKLALNDDLLQSSVPDDPYLSQQLQSYFPKPMREAYAAEIDDHRLRREILPTMLANSIINRGGPSFVTRLMDETGRSAGDVATAFAVARDSFDYTELNSLVDRLDARIPGAVQNGLYLELQRFQRWSTIWFLRHESLKDGLDSLIARYRAGIAALEGTLADYLPEAAQSAVAARRQSLEAAGVPADTVLRLAEHTYLQRGLDVVKIAGDTGHPLEAVAQALFAPSQALQIDKLIAAANGMSAKDFVERQAINRLVAQVFGTHRAIVSNIVTAPQGDWQTWRTKRGDDLAHAVASLEALVASRPFDLARLAVAQGTLADLSRR
jgi:glutamate dehydrogenase